MLKKRNAQGLSINVIILAVLGILVLFALVVLFNTEKDKTAGTLASCFVRGGECIDEGTCTDGTILSEITCSKKDNKEQECCVTV